MYDGMINVRKEKGYTSHDVVAKLRGILHQKKIGHTGTLDPDAVGVLPVCLGKGTKLCDLMTDRDKTYETVMLLGRTTDTQDLSGQVLSEAAVDVSEEAIRRVAESFIGGYMQIPPMYSAIKIHGQKLYALARAGREVERPPRPVVIHSLTITDITRPYVRMTVCCSKGTYIRTLCHDMGEKLGCGACMAELIRTQVGGFALQDAWTLDEIQAMAEQGEEEVRRHMVSVEQMLMDHDAVQTVDAEADRMLKNGNRLAESQVDRMPAGGSDPFADGQELRVYASTGEFVAVYAYDSGTQSLKSRKMFV